MRRTIIIILVALISTFITSCTDNQPTENKVITVTIEPIKGLLEAIVGEDFVINTLLPVGASPESYSPTIQQLASLEDSQMVFHIGTLPFENELLRHNELKDIKSVNLSYGVELITGAHHHHKQSEDLCEHDKANANHPHHHSADPHIWVSLDELSTIVNNIDSALMAAYPDSAKYHANCQQLIGKIAANKQRYKQMLITAPKDVLIYHPALGYLAKSLSFNQIAVENEGKSPTPASLSELVTKVKAEGIEVMLYQKEYPLDIIQPIADILDVKLVEINPLSCDIIGEIDKIVNIIAGRYEQ